MKPPTTSSASMYFGISVTPHIFINKNVRSEKYVILVGATRANITTKNPGAIFMCTAMRSPSTCRDINFLFNETKGILSFDRRNQLLGMVVVSATLVNGSRAFTCAPGMKTRYEFSNENKWAGGCFALNNNLTAMKKHLTGFDCTKYFSPKNRLAPASVSRFCARGFSMSVVSDDIWVAGAPFESIRDGANVGAIVLHEMLGGRNVRVYDKDFNTFPNYLGWSTTLGRRIFAGSNLTVVSGAPSLPNVIVNMADFKEAELGVGQVLLLRIGPGGKSTFGQRLMGDQFASRFGHAVLVTDINNDGWEDVLVGAPQYRSGETMVGGGAVYVYLNNGGKLLKRWQMLRPPRMTVERCRVRKCALGQFGFALADLKDINLDGFPDVAISSPSESSGVVYVYHGSAEGLRPTPVQTLSPPPGKISLFGYSMAPAVDFDGNGYPDLVVGAPPADQVLLFRTRPVMLVTASLPFTPKTLNLPKITQDGKKWTSCTSNEGHCLKTKLTVTCRRARKKDKVDSLSGSVVIEADIFASRLGYGPRIQLVDNGKVLRSRIERNVKCTESTKAIPLTLFLKKNNFIDMLNPIHFRARWNFSTPSNNAPVNNVLSALDSPVNDPANSNRTFEYKWDTFCPDTGCTSQLHLKMATTLKKSPKSPYKYVYFVGKDNLLWMNFTVSNYIGVAHLVQLKFYSSDLITVDKSHCPFGCTLRSDGADCRVANPLKSGQVADCNLRITTSNVRPETSRLNFSAVLSTISRNIDDPTKQTRLNYSASVTIMTDVKVTSTVEPYQIVYRNWEVKGAAAIKHEKQIGEPVVEIVFTVENWQASIVPSSFLTVWWPYEMVGDSNEAHGKYLLYMLTKPTTESKTNITCDPAALCRLVNPNKVRLITKNSPAAPYSPKRYRRAVNLHQPQFDKCPEGPRSVICSGGEARCFPLKCRIDNLGKTTGVHKLKFSARAWAHTFVEEFESRRYVELKVLGRWTPDLRFSVLQVNNTVPESEAVLVASNAMKRKPRPPQNFALIIAAASIAGVILFGCIVIILWKCNFFKRASLEQTRQTKNDED